MIFTTFKRITRTGFVNFWRNGFLSFSAVIVITLSLLAFGALIFSSAFGQALLADVREKVDIKVYFVISAKEDDIKEVQSDLESLPEVVRVDYSSREQVLADFQEKWKDNALIMQGLEEIGSNPFPASLNVKSTDPRQYGSIASYLEDKRPTDSAGNPIIEKINYAQNKLVIDRLSRIIPAVDLPLAGTERRAKFPSSPHLAQDPICHQTSSIFPGVTQKARQYASVDKDNPLQKCRRCHYLPHGIAL